jgi:hypothetical protein
MNDQTSFRRIAAISAIISAPVAVASWVLVILAVGFNSEQLVSDLEYVIGLGVPADQYFHLAWKFTDTFGYILLFAPVAFYLWLWLKSRNPNLVTFSALSAFAYMLTGAITVSAMGGVVPPMMRTYAEASGLEREVLLITFQGVYNMLYYGIGPITYLFGGVWWLGTGAVLRKEQRILGIVTMILGVLALGVWLAQTFFYTESVVETVYFLLVPIWALWLGIVIWRRAEESDVVLEPAASV